MLVPAVMEFRQRQMEIELRQLTISLKMGEDHDGEVSHTH